MSPEPWPKPWKTCLGNCISAAAIRRKCAAFLRNKNALASTAAGRDESILTLIRSGAAARAAFRLGRSRTPFGSMPPVCPHTSGRRPFSSARHNSCPRREIPPARAAGDPCGHAVEQDRFAQTFPDAPQQFRHRVPAAARDDHGREFVAAHAGKSCLGPQGGAQAPRELLSTVSPQKWPSVSLQALKAFRSIYRNTKCAGCGARQSASTTRFSLRRLYRPVRSSVSAAWRSRRSFSRRWCATTAHSPLMTKPRPS